MNPYMQNHRKNKITVVYNMKIIFLIRSLDYGGAERQLVTLAKGLHGLGHSVVVAVFYPGGQMETDLNKAGVSVKSLEKKGRWDVMGFLWRLILLVRRENPDILHSYLTVPNIISVLLKPVFPSLKVVWGVRASDMDLSKYDTLSRLSYRLECLLSRFTDFILANSQAGFHYAVKHGFPKSKMDVIYNGIDTERFYPDAQARHRIRMEWGVHEGEKLIGIVGRLDPMKDHQTFLEAAAHLAKQRDDVRFVCIGDGPKEYCNKLQTLGNDLRLRKRLIWAGARKDMHDVYNALDIATSSSISEGFSNVIGEAMSCGIPCVVTDVGDSALLVGNAGVVVPPKNSYELASGWLYLLNHPKEYLKLSVLSRERIICNFNLEVLYKKTSYRLTKLTQ